MLSQLFTSQRHLPRLSEDDDGGHTYLELSVFQAWTCVSSFSLHSNPLSTGTTTFRAEEPEVPKVLF